MNSCILMATIVRDPELRSTQDGVNVSSMLVEFPSSREEEPPGTLKVEGWGNLASEMKDSYSIGNKIVIEGRLSMNLLERDGYKEKKATLVASRIYPIGSSNISSASSMTNNQSYETPSTTSSSEIDFAPNPQTAPVSSAAKVATTPEPAAPTNDNNEDWDEIPF